jgi:DNA-binding winged helix-turn-helix (wHTH) protein
MSDSYRLDVSRGVLTWRDRSVHLGPVLVRIFASLAAGRGSVVPRDVLFRSVWPGAKPVEKALDVDICRLRNILVRGGIPDPIAASHRVGYEIEADVEIIGPAAVLVPPSSVVALRRVLELHNVNLLREIFG